MRLRALSQRFNRWRKQINRTEVTKNSIDRITRMSLLISERVYLVVSRMAVRVSVVVPAALVLGHWQRLSYRRRNAGNKTVSFGMNLAQLEGGRSLPVFLAM